MGPRAAAMICLACSKVKSTSMANAGEPIPPNTNSSKRPSPVFCRLSRPEELMRSLLFRLGWLDAKGIKTE